MLSLNVYGKTDVRYEQNLYNGYYATKTNALPGQRRHCTLREHRLLACVKDLLLELLKVYSGFLNDGVLLLNVSSHNFRQGWLMHCQEQAEECVYQQSVFYSVSLIHSFSSIDH